MSDGSAEAHEVGAAANVIDLAAAREARMNKSATTSTALTRLPVDVAMHLLSENGWRVSDGPLGGCWIAPDGSTIYGIDDALEVALTARTGRASGRGTSTEETPRR